MVERKLKHGQRRKINCLWNALAGVGQLLRGLISSRSRRSSAVTPRRLDTCACTSAPLKNSFRTVESTPSGPIVGLPQRQTGPPTMSCSVTCRQRCRRLVYVRTQRRTTVRILRILKSSSSLFVNRLDNKAQGALKVAQQKTKHTTLCPKNAPGLNCCNVVKT